MTNCSRCYKCRRYCRLVSTFLFSHIGLCGLVVGYSLVGAFTFEALEAGYEKSKRQLMLKERENVITDLWLLTETSSVLCEKNWSVLATEALQDFEVTLVRAVRKEGYDGKEESPLQWSFSGALLYSIIVITTIGYGNVAPKTPWGKIITIFYAIIGIPLLLLCLSNIGDAMAHSFKFIYWKVCCYFCIRPKKNRKRTANRIFNAPYRSTNNVPVKSLPAIPVRNEVTESPQLQSSSTYYTAPSSASPTISSCKSTPRHEPFSHMVFPSVKLEASSIPSRANHINISYHDHHLLQDINKAPVITNKYAMQDHVDSRPLQLDGKTFSAGPDIFTIMNPSLIACNGTQITHPSFDRKLLGKDSHYFENDGDNLSDDSMSYISSDEGTQEEVSVPMWLCFALVIGYICGGAVLFTFWEQWNFLDSSYFCFVTLTTIGFGDLVPGTAVISDDNQLTLGLCSLYLLFGMALLAMSFNLVQEEVTRTVRCVGKRIGILYDDDDDD